MAPLHSPNMIFVLVAVIATTVSCMASPPATGAEGGGTFAQATPSSNDFYLRAGISLDWSNDAHFQDSAEACVSPTHLYLPRQGTCNRLGNDGAPLRTVGDFGAIPGFEIGVGYAALPFLRLEGIVQYRPRFSFEGLSNFRDIPTEYRQEVSADVSARSAMLAAYIDLSKLGPFSTFFGGGIGLSRMDIDESRMELPGTTFVVPAGHRTNLAWMLTAGVAMPMGERTILDLAWRYIDSGTVETGRGVGRVVWRDGSRDPLPLDLAETQARLSSHGLQASIRYAF